MERFFEIASAEQLIDVPLSQAQMIRLARMCGVTARTRILDLACGKGELLIQWAREFELQGTGVDSSETRINAAHHRAGELEVWSQVHFAAADVMEYPQPFHQYNIVSLLEATGTGTDLASTIRTMREALKTESGGLVLIGDIFWQKEPTPQVCQALEIEREWVETLASLSEKFTAAGLELMDMLIVGTEDRDRHYSEQWRACLRWLDDHAEDDDAPALRAWLTKNRQMYLSYERDYLGWGVFVLSAPGTGESAPVEEEVTQIDEIDLKFDWQTGDA